MTEMKEKIYPTLPVIRESPSAPDIELTEMRNEGAHSSRLKVIMDVQKYLEEEITKRVREPGNNNYKPNLQSFIDLLPKRKKLQRDRLGKDLSLLKKVS